MLFAPPTARLLQTSPRFEVPKLEFRALKTLASFAASQFCLRESGLVIVISAPDLPNTASSLSATRRHVKAPLPVGAEDVTRHRTTNCTIAV